jgi:hypothetical protein
LKAIYDDLLAQNRPVLDLAEEVDPRIGEGVMFAERRATPAFFNHGGIYQRLLEKHPSFALPATAKTAEDEAIQDLILEIQRRLAVAIDRLTGAPVGVDAARDAVLYPHKRWRREYQKSPTQVTFDEIGLLHSALRLILNDNTHHPRSHWRTSYFDGRSSHNDHTYRHYLALIWKGATEDEIEAPLTHIGMHSRELREMGVTQFIAVLAQCRREHNHDGLNPDWVQSRAPQDAQRCDIGLRGDLYGQMLLHNDRYMQTRTTLNVELLELMIRDIIFDLFSGLEDDIKIKIVSYLDNKSVTFTDPEPAEIEVIRDFIQLIHRTVRQLLVDKLNSLDSTSPLNKVREYLANINQKFSDGDESAAIALPRIMENIQNYIRLEADSLLFLDHTNSANMDFLRRFATLGISKVYQQRLREVLTGNRVAIDQHLLRYQQLINRANGLTYIVDSELIRAVAFNIPLVAQKKARLEAIIDNYKEAILMMKSHITEMIRVFSDRAPIDGRFGFAGDAGVDARLRDQQQEFISSQERILPVLDELIGTLDVIRARLQSSDVLTVDTLRPHLQDLFRGFAHEKTPEFFAKYIWALLLEKTPAGHYYYSDTENNELRTVLDIIFGDEVKAMTGFERAKKNLILYGLNVEQVNVKSLMGEKASRRADILDAYFRSIGINLYDTCYRPSEKKVTLSEVSFIASKTPSLVWGRIIDRSGTGDELLTFTDVTDPEERAHIRRSPEQLMNIAKALPISHYSSPELPLDSARQARALRIWTAIAKAIIEEDTTNQLLINYVIQTVMAHLSITEFVKEDQTLIIMIIRCYMGWMTHPYNFPLPFALLSMSDILDTRIDCVANHLSILLTTLSVPSVKYSFETGIVRLMSRNDAMAKAGSNKYLVRVSNLNPSQLVVSTGSDNQYLEFPRSDTFTVLGLSQTLARFSDQEFQAAVRAKVGCKTEVTVALEAAAAEDAPPTLTSMGTSTYQSARGAAYAAVAVAYGVSSLRQSAADRGFAGVSATVVEVLGARDSLHYLERRVEDHRDGGGAASGAHLAAGVPGSFFSAAGRVSTPDDRVTSSQLRPV